MTTHFEGKTVLEHLKEAHERGAKAVGEGHGFEPSGFFSALVDACKMMILVAGLAWMVFGAALWIFGAGFLLWQVFRTAMLGWNRLERLHRLIEQERWEIMHHREEEKEELKQMYQLKGFSGELLDRIVDVLMADDYRLLMVMLQEELGLKLRSQEHPLLQALGALVGGIIGFGSIVLGVWAGGLMGLATTVFVLMVALGWLAAYRDGNLIVKAIVWNLACAFAVFGLTFCLMEIFHAHLPRSL